MKRAQKVFLTGLAALSLLALSGCESDGSPPPLPPIGGGGTGTPLIFRFDPPGRLIPGTGHDATSTGVTSPTIVAPGMRFPYERGPVFANSQVWGHGGAGGSIFGPAYPPAPGGTQGDAENYRYPWKDNFCEQRGWNAPKCPAGKGHQGQDIRPPTCEAEKYWAVTTEAGRIGYVGTVSVELITDTGQVHRYLHLERPLASGIVAGARVAKGQRIGRISNVTGRRSNGTLSRATTVHLHFEIWDGNSDGSRNLGVGPLPLYTSLIDSYRRLLRSSPISNFKQPLVNPCHTH